MISKYGQYVAKYIQLPRKRILLYGTRSLVTSDATTTKSLEDMPSPPSWPLIGCVPDLSKVGFQKMHIYMKDLAAKHGRIYKLQFGPTVMVCLSDVIETEKVFRMEGKYPRREPLMKAWTVYHKQRETPTGLLFMTGESWERHRNSLNPKLMKPRQVHFYLPYLNDIADDMLHVISESRDEQGNVSDLKKWLWNWSLEGIIRVLYEKRLNCLQKGNTQGEDFINNNRKMFKQMTMLMGGGPLLDNALSPVRRSFFKNLDIVYDQHYKMLDEKMDDFVKKHGDSPDLTEDSEQEFIPFLYYNRNMSRKDIVASIMSLMLAAQDTTTTTLMWAFYALSINPDKQELLRQDIKSNIKPGEPVSFKSIDKMKYMSAFIKEIMRYYSPVPAHSRILEEDIELKGYLIPKNTMILPLLNVMSWDPSYVQNPDKFLPERWLRGSGEKINPFVSNYFGYGKRMCIGKRLAVTQMSLLLAKVLSKYHVECDAPHNLQGEMIALVEPEIPINFKFIEI